MRSPLEMMSPVLVGALTVLIAVITVFLSYNAGNSLPFVPTYDITVAVPDAQELSANNEVLVAGRRVGVIGGLEPELDANGRPYAQLQLRLDQTMEGKIHPDAIVLVRARSLLGAKYLELQLGSTGKPLPQGGGLPLAQSRTEVEVDEVLDEFDAPTRRHFQEVLGGFGDAFASRGLDFNASLASLRPLTRDSTVVLGELADPANRLDDFVRAYAAFASELGANPENLAGILRNGGVTLAALDRPALGESIDLSPATLQSGTDALGVLRPVLAHARAITHRVAPGTRLLPSTANELSKAADVGIPVVRRSEILGPLLEDAFGELGGLATREPSVPALDSLAGALPDLRSAVEYLTPYQTVCNYVALGSRNLASTVSEGTASGNWLRFSSILNADEMFPHAAPAPNLHFNPYPNGAAPGQPHECEAGNEGYLPGQQIGNVPGNQGTQTELTSPEQTAEVSK